MNRLVIIAAIASLCLIGCGSKNSVRRTPSLEAPPAGAQQPPAKPGILEQVGDATVRIVREPARIVSPKKPDPKQPPQVYDPPTATIMRRPWVDPAAPATQPDHP